MRGSIFELRKRKQETEFCTALLYARRTPSRDFAHPVKTKIKRRYERAYPTPAFERGDARKKEGGEGAGGVRQF
jgi:hypothetical protein